MKYQIRKGLFETNSSSSHSFTFEGNGGNKYDVEFVDDENYINEYVKIGYHEFGWACREVTDINELITYFYLQAYYLDRDNSTKDCRERLQDELLSVNSSYIIDPKLMEDINDDFEQFVWNHIGYIDHQSTEDRSMDDMYSTYGISHIADIFRPEYSILTGNDNGYDSHPSGWFKPKSLDTKLHIDKTNKVIADYNNGNYHVRILSDGTKIRTLENGVRFIPHRPETIDINIQTRCDGNCPYCYISATGEGKYGDLTLPFFDTIAKGTEIAINLNDLSHPQLDWFLEKMRKQGVIVNGTINQKHFMIEENLKRLEHWVNNKLLYGLGISLTNNADDITHEFIKCVQQFPNTVIHTIAGITTREQFHKIEGEDLRLLVLGFKNKGRGKGFKIDESSVDYLQNIDSRKGSFRTISFDNLAFKQLGIRDKITDWEYNRCYMGEDGEYSFYIDTVTKKYFTSSTSTRGYPLLEKIKDMFKSISFWEA